MEQFGEEREIGKTRKKEKQSLASKNGYESMNRRPWIKILEEFYATVLTKDGEDYKLNGFHEMVTTVEWYLTEKEYKRSIILEEVVEVWNEFLTKKPDICACILLLVITWLSYF